jgi:hypothetical protein
VTGKAVKSAAGDLLRATRTKDRRRPALDIEIVTPPGGDAHATVALATAALTLGVDLSPTRAMPNFNGDNVGAALRYGPGV